MQRLLGHIALARIGPVDARVPRYLRTSLEPVFSLPVWLLDEELPLAGWHSARGQYLGEALLEQLHPAIPLGAVRILGLTAEDIFAPEMNFIFGEAEVGGPAAVVSFHRLRPEFYGEAPDAQLFLRRVLVECTHELGHTFGLTHCPIPSCVMSFSDSIEQADAKGPGFCATHAGELRVALSLN